MCGVRVHVFTARKYMRKTKDPDIPDSMMSCKHPHKQTNKKKQKTKKWTYTHDLGVHTDIQDIMI